MPASEFWEKIIKKQEDIVAREIAGETILVPVRGTLVDMQKIWSLNPVGGFIWKNLDGTKSLGIISNELISEFDVEKERADADIQEFVEELLKVDLVR